MSIRNIWNIRALIVLLGVTLVFSVGAVNTFADDSGVNSKPTLQQLRDKYNELGTPPKGEATFATHVNTEGYTPATLSTEARTYAEKYINFMRFQAGLDPITLDSTLNANAAQGALILARLNNGLTHYPTTPSGVTDVAAAPGKYATANSNLSYSSSWPSPDGMSIIEDAILGQMKDERPQSNVDCLGHRRWLIKPSTSTMGIGAALLVNRGDWNKSYSAIRVMNGSDPQNSYGKVQDGNSTDCNFVAWPASGYMLNTVFDYRTPWSVHLNKNKYNAPESGSVQVGVTRRSDNKKWTLNSSSPNTFADGGYITGNYFNINNQGYGDGYCIIFCPNPNELGSGKLDDIFDVEVTGLSPKTSGISSTIQYTVNFKGLASEKSVSSQMIILNNTSFTYNGSNQKPSVTVKDGETTLVEGTDYTLTNNGGTNVGTYYVSVTGKGNYTGSAQKSFTINPKKITAPTANTGLIYSGATQQGVTALSDYTVSDGSAVNAGTYTATVALNDSTNTTWTDGSTEEKKITWSISPKNLTEGMLTIEPAQFTYDGSNQKPTVTVKDGTKTLTAGRDYTLTNDGGTDAGQYNVKVDGKGNYTGSITNSFTVNSKSVNAEMIYLDQESFEYTGSIQKPTVTVKDGTKTLTANTDYTLTNNGGTDVGEYEVRITGKGNYTGQAVKKFNIVKGSTPISETSVTLSENTYEYDGNAKKPQVGVKNGSTTLILDTDYTVSYNNNVDAGQATVTISGKGDYSGSITKNFTIEKATNSVTITTANGWTEGSASVQPTVSARFGADTVRFIYSTSAGGTYTDTVPATKGTYYVKAIINEAKNYKNAESAPVQFEIAENTGGSNNNDPGNNNPGGGADTPSDDPGRSRVGIDGTALGPGASAAVAEAAIMSSTSDEGPAGSIFAKLALNSKSQTKKSVKIGWKRVPGASRYVVYGNACGKNYRMVKVADTTGTSSNIKVINGRSLKKGTYYKFIVVAINGSNEVVSASKTVHVATAGGKVGNHKSVKTAAKRNKVVIKKGKSFKLKGKGVVKAKKLKVKAHRPIRYETSNAGIATVSKGGVVKARSKGTCYIYAYAQNGIYKRIKIRVK